jgi:putative cell wall-binding protein
MLWENLFKKCVSIKGWSLLHGINKLIKLNIFPLYIWDNSIPFTKAIEPKFGELKLVGIILYSVIVKLSDI